MLHYLLLNTNPIFSFYYASKTLPSTNKINFKQELWSQVFYLGFHQLIDLLHPCTSQSIPCMHSVSTFPTSFYHFGKDKWLSMLPIVSLIGSLLFFKEMFGNSMGRLLQVWNPTFLAPLRICHETLQRRSTQAIKLGNSSCTCLYLAQPSFVVYSLLCSILTFANLLLEFDLSSNIPSLCYRWKRLIAFSSILWSNLRTCTTSGISIDSTLFDKAFIFFVI